jgi:hypothetical protein
MELAVKVRWLGNERSALLSTDRAESSYGIPVLVMEGQALATAELPNGAKIIVSWRKPRRGPVWQMIESAQNAGYPIELARE